MKKHKICQYFMKKEENCKLYRMTHYGKQLERKLKYKHVFDILHICIKLPCSEQQETEDYNVKKIRYIMCSPIAKP